ncbi:MAG: hypothetical protein IJN68_04035 [Clostridia bacterium]|nr:hypothetical protein [Clostridia bacterium]
MLYAVYVTFALVFFLLRLVLCFKARKALVRFIPVYLIVGSYLIALLFAEDILDGGSGFVDGGALAGAVIAVAASCAAAGDALGWAVYLIIKKYRKNRRA